MKPSRGVTVTLAVLALGAATLLAACDSGTPTLRPTLPPTSSPATTPDASHAAGQSSPTPKGSATAKSSTSAKPTPTPKPTKTPKPTPTPSDTSSPSASPSQSASPTPTPTPGPGSVCSGSGDNKQFWTQAAASMTWDVYCPALPAGWHVIAGEYHTAKGGTLTISYGGPGGARIELKEGAFCTDGLSACSPHDTVIGTAAFGDRSGSLDTLGPGLGLAIYVNPGTPPSWQIVGTGLDQAAFKGIAAGLEKVAKS